MRYTIQPPDDVIEASYSAAPDDVSVVSIRIKAERSGPPVESLDDLRSITFTVPDGLSTNPSSITPQAMNFDEWEMAVEGGGAFVATPRRWETPDGATSPIPVLSGGPWVFFLRDVEVAVGAGDTALEVAETRTAGVVSKPDLSIRKVDPKLRIDYFHAIDASDTPVDASIKSGESVTLVWATAGATRVSLFGPAFVEEPTAGGELPVDDHDGRRTVKPTTTTTYTLVATNAISGGHAVAQVTVTVEDRLEVAGPLVARSVADQHGPVIPVGLISMWSGSTVPAGWALCDGKTHNGHPTPNLQGRFIVGLDPSDADFNALGNTDGEKEVALTVEQMPEHTHTIEGGGSHAHTITGHSFWGSSRWATDPSEVAKLFAGGAEKTRNTSESSNHDHTATVAGGGQAHTNLPPYYVLAFIMKVDR
jgi:microcystin-dependent protein